MAKIKHTGDEARDHIAKLHGTEIEVVKAAEPGDEGYSPKYAKTVVKLPDGKLQTVLNDEIGY